MSVRIERAPYDPETGFLYYVAFKANLEIGVEEVYAREDVDVTASITETGDLADMTFLVPKALRTQHALTFVCGDSGGQFVEPHVFLAVPDSSGDAVASIPGRLELDATGRIVGMALHWLPEPAPSA